MFYKGIGLIGDFSGVSEIVGVSNFGAIGRWMTKR